MEFKPRRVTFEELSERLREYERKYGFSTIDFYRRYQNGELGDDDDLMMWGGLYHWLGVSNFTVQEMQRARAIAPITSLQPPYSLICREIETSILPYCLEEKIEVIVYSPMYNGLLSGTMTRERIRGLPDNDWRKFDPEFNEPNLAKNLTPAER